MRRLGHGGYISTLVAVVSLGCMVSCRPILSFQPWYTEKDIVFDSALLGSWFDPLEKNSDAVLTFEKGPENSYKVTFVDTSGKQPIDLIFDARLMKLGSHLFVDAVQVGAQMQGQDVEVGAVVPGHIIGRISVQGDTLQISFLDDDWVNKQIETGTVSIRHEDADGTPVLTASTVDLQKLLLDHAEDDKAFDLPLSELHRKK